jgi:hypothetical protein
MYNKMRMEDFLVISSGRLCCSKANYSCSRKEQVLGVDKILVLLHKGGSFNACTL